MATDVLPREVDAVVVGGGHNGLVSAALMADRGWSVLLLEAQPELGGAIRSVEDDGWVTDLFSSSYPLARSSPVLDALRLEELGLRWARADVAVAHPLGPADPQGAVIHRDPEVTAANLGEDHPQDERSWLDLFAEYQRIRDPLLETLLTAWPPVRAGLRLHKRLGGTAELFRFSRFLMLPSTRMGAELFRGRRGRTLLAGNAMHADIPPIAPGSGLFGWLMMMLAQDVGFPVPVGGAGKLVDALAARASLLGADIRVGEPVIQIVADGTTAKAVRTASGHTVVARRAIVADVAVPTLYRELLPEASVASRLLADLDRFVWDYPTVKINYRLSGTPQWTAWGARTAGVVHAGADVDGVVHWSADLETGRLADTPFALIGQTTCADSSRSPPGTQAMWAYSHLPRGVADDEAAQQVARHVDAMIERHAPAFGDLILDRAVQTPSALNAADVNLVGGAINGGTAQIFQQLVFRPSVGLGGPRTPIDRLYVGSAGTHPGGGVHGACGALAARAALTDNGMFGGARRRAVARAVSRFYRSHSDAPSSSD
jgi:phytoene dehydrogenase-like protein